jgi:hypothetical protein
LNISILAKPTDFDVEMRIAETLLGYVSLDVILSQNVANLASIELVIFGATFPLDDVEMCFVAGSFDHKLEFKVVHVPRLKVYLRLPNVSLVPFHLDATFAHVAIRIPVT